MSYSEYKKQLAEKKANAAAVQKQSSGFAAYKAQKAAEASGTGRKTATFGGTERTLELPTNADTHAKKLTVQEKKIQAADKKTAEAEKKKAAAAAEVQRYLEYDIEAAEKEIRTLEGATPFVSGDWWDLLAEEWKYNMMSTDERDAYLQESQPMSKDARTARISELSKEIQTAKQYQTTKKYYDKTQAADFAEKSQRNADGSDLDAAVYFDYSGRENDLDRGHRAEYDALVAAGEHEAAEDYLILQLGGPSDYDQQFLQHLTEEEKSIFNYIRNTEGEESAEEYLRFMQENLNARAAFADYNARSHDGAGGFVGDVLASFATGIGSGVTGIGNLFSNSEKPESYAEYKQGLISENASGIKKVAMDAAHSIGNMVPSIGVWLVSPVAGRITFGASAAGNAKQAALREDFTVSQANQYGILVGVSEAAIEKILGGIPGLSLGTLGKATSAGVGKIGSVLFKASPKVEAVLRTVGNLTGEAVGEANEEWMQSMLETVFRNVCFGEDGESKPFSEEALYSALRGAGTSGVMNSVQLGSTYTAAERATLANKVLGASEGYTSEAVKDARETLIQKHNDGSMTAEDARAVITEAIKEDLQKSEDANSQTVGNLDAEGENSFAEAKGIFDPTVGTAKAPATQEQFNEYVDYAYRYASETREKGNTSFPKQNKTIHLGQVSEVAADEVQKAFGVNIFGYQNSIQDNDIRHIKNSHGEQTNEKYPVTAADIKKIPDIIENFDDVLYVARKDGKNGIVFVKRHNGVTYYLEQILGEKMLIGKQMIKTSTGTVPKIEGLAEAIQKKWGTTPGQMANAPRMYVQDVRNSTTTISAKGVDYATANAETGTMTPEAQLPYSTTDSIAQSGGESQEGKSHVANVRSHLSAEGRAFFDYVMQSAAAGTESRVADAVELHYLRGFLGERFSADTDILSDAAGLDIYNAGVAARRAIGTVTVGEGVQVSKAFRAFMERVAKDLQVHITYGGKAPKLGENVERGYMTRYGELHVYADAKVQGFGQKTLYGDRAAAVILMGHEMTHRLAQTAPREYASLSSFVLDQMGESAVQAYMRKYSLSREDALEEIVANYAMRKLFADEKSIRALTKKHSRLAEKIREILLWIRDKLGHPSNEVDTAIRLWNAAYTAAAGNVKDASVHAELAQSKNALRTEGAKRSVNEGFDTAYDDWVNKYGRRKDMRLLVGTASEALQSIGVRAQNIYWDTSKILDSIHKHPELDDDVLKQVPELLENPILILESNSIDAKLKHPAANRVVLLGEVYGNNDIPIMAVLELEPTSKKGLVLRQIKLVSTYTKVRDIDRNRHKSEQITGTQNLINESDILYIEPKKERTTTWLRRNRLQLPFGATKYGSIGMISYSDDLVNTYSMQNSEKDAKKSLSGSEELDAQLEAEAERERKASMPIARKLSEMEKADRAAGKRYTMSLDTFEQVAWEYMRRAGMDEETEKKFSKKLFSAAVNLAAAQRSSGDAKVAYYDAAYRGFKSAAYMPERENAQAREALAEEMLVAMLEAGYAGMASTEGVRMFMNTREEAMDKALSQGKKVSTSEIVLRRENFKKSEKIEALLRDNRELRKKADEIQKDVKKEYRQKYSEWKEETEKKYLQKYSEWEKEYGDAVREKIEDEAARKDEHFLERKWRKEYEQKKDALGPTGLKLLEMEEEARAKEKIYEMRIEPFEQVAWFYAGYLQDLKDKQEFVLKLYSATVYLSGAMNGIQKPAKVRKYIQSLLWFERAARMIESDEALVERKAKIMMMAMLEVGYRDKKSFTVVPASYLNARQKKMDAALQTGKEVRLSEINLLRENYRRTERVSELLRDNRELRKKADELHVRGEVRKEYLEKYSKWKEEYHESDTVQKQRKRIEKNLSDLYKWSVKPDKKGHSVPEGARSAILTMLSSFDMVKTKKPELTTQRDILWGERMRQVADALSGQEEKTETKRMTDMFIPLTLIERLRENAEKIANGERIVLEKKAVTPPDMPPPLTEGFQKKELPAETPLQNPTPKPTDDFGADSRVTEAEWKAAMDGTPTPNKPSAGEGGRSTDGAPVRFKTEGERISVYDLRGEALRALDESLCILKKCVAEANEMHLEGRKVEIDKVAAKEKARLAGMKKQKKPLLSYDLMDSMSYAETVGGLFCKLIKKLRRQFDIFVRATNDVERFTKETVQGQDVQSWRTHARAVTFGTNVCYMTDAQLMSLYLLNKREQARKHIYGDGIRIDLRALEKSDSKKAREWAKEQIDLAFGPIEAADVEQAVALLSKEQIEVADKLQGFMETVLADMGNTVTMRLYGFAAYGEKNYFPIRTSAESLNSIAEENNAADGIFAVTSQGFTKNTNEYAKNALVVEDMFGVFITHASEMLNYYAYAEAVTDCMRVYNHKAEGASAKLGSILEATYDGSSGYFANLIKSLNRQKAFGHTSMDHLFTKATGHTKAAMMGLNARVAIQQPTSFLRAAAVMHPKYLAHAAKKVKFETIMTYCPIARWKSWGFYDMDIGRNLDSILFGEGNTYEKLREGQMAGASFMDKLTFCALWNACEAEVRDRQKHGGERKNAESPTWGELIRKADMPIVELSDGDGEANMSYAELKARALAKAEAEHFYDAPHRNADTGMDIFIGKDAFTHAFSNLRSDFGRDTILAMENIRSLIENAVLTQVDPPKDPNKAETKVYSLFAAVRGENGVEPVKLTVKEYSANGTTPMPEKIRQYFEKQKKQPSYRRLYDAKALEIVSIEKEEPDASASIADSRESVVKGTPDSTISIAELLQLVNGDAKKYIPEATVEDKTEEFYTAVGERLSDVIDQTQVVDSPFHRVQATRAGGELTKAALSFQSENLKSLNLLHRMTRQGKKPTLRAFLCIEAAQMTAAMLAGILDALRDDDDETDLFEKWLQSSFENMVQNMNLLSAVPVVGEYAASYSARIVFGIWDALFDTNLSRYAPRVYESEGYSEMALSETVSAVEALWSNTSWYDKVYTGLRAISLATGIGWSNAFRDTVGVVYNLTNGVSPKGAYKKALAEGDAEKIRENYTAFFTAKCEALSESRLGMAYDALSSVEKKKIEQSAKTSIKATTRALFEEDYIKAWQKGDEEAITSIRRTLLATELYTKKDIAELFLSFKKSYYKDAYKKADEEEKEALVKEAVRGKVFGSKKLALEYFAS